jgi:hypothetical protein
VVKNSLCLGAREYSNSTGRKGCSQKTLKASRLGEGILTLCRKVEGSHGGRILGRGVKEQLYFRKFNWKDGGRSFR